MDAINSGATVLVVSDAGMPIISDPGYRLVAACVAAGLAVQCLPGPSAVTTALVVSGLPAEKFCFEGFAPRKGSARRTWLATLADERRTCVFFESPRRLAACLRDAVEQLGGVRQAAICRELTKVHEEVVRGSLDELAAWATGGVLGEITVVLAGATPRADLSTLVPDLVSEVETLVAGGIRVKDACSHVAAGYPEVRSRQLYEAVLTSRREADESDQESDLAKPAQAPTRSDAGPGRYAQRRVRREGRQGGQRRQAAAPAGRQSSDGRRRTAARQR